MGWGLLLSEGRLLTKQDLLNLSIFFNIVEFPEALAEVEEVMNGKWLVMGMGFGGGGDKNEFKEIGKDQIM